MRIINLNMQMLDYVALYSWSQCHKQFWANLKLTTLTGCCMWHDYHTKSECFNSMWLSCAMLKYVYDIGGPFGCDVLVLSCVTNRDPVTNNVFLMYRNQYQMQNFLSYVFIPRHGPSHALYFGYEQTIFYSWCPYSSVVLSLPTILWPRVLIPSSPSTLVSLCFIEVVMRKGRK